MPTIETSWFWRLKTSWRVSKGTDKLWKRKPDKQTCCLALRPKIFIFFFYPYALLGNKPGTPIAGQTATENGPIGCRLGTATCRKNISRKPSLSRMRWQLTSASRCHVTHSTAGLQQSKSPPQPTNHLHNPWSATTHRWNPTSEWHHFTIGNRWISQLAHQNDGMIITKKCFHGHGQVLCKTGLDGQPWKILSCMWPRYPPTSWEEWIDFDRRRELKKMKTWPGLGFFRDQARDGYGMQPNTLVSGNSTSGTFISMAKYEPCVCVRVFCFVCMESFWALAAHWGSMWYVIKYMFLLCLHYIISHSHFEVCVGAFDGNCLTHCLV